MTIRFRSNEHFFFFFSFCGKRIRVSDTGIINGSSIVGTGESPLRIIDSIALFPVRHVSKCDHRENRAD